MSRYGERQRAKWARSGALRLGTWQPPFPADWKGPASWQLHGGVFTMWARTPLGWVQMEELPAFDVPEELLLEPLRFEDWAGIRGGVPKIEIRLR